MNHVERYFDEWAHEITPQGWLSYLRNTYGPFQLAHARKNADNTATWTKWRDYDECNNNDQAFTNAANNRTILPCELVIDLEDPKQLNQAIDYLHHNQIFNHATFKTGSRGYHIHIIHALFDPQQNPTAKQLKLKIIRETGGDTIKANPKVMIALEFKPHWKTGRAKEYVNTNGENNGR